MQREGVHACVTDANGVQPENGGDVAGHERVHPSSLASTGDASLAELLCNTRDHVAVGLRRTSNLLKIPAEQDQEVPLTPCRQQ